MFFVNKKKRSTEVNGPLGDWAQYPSIYAFKKSKFGERRLNEGPLAQYAWLAVCLKFAIGMKHPDRIELYKKNLKQFNGHLCISAGTTHHPANYAFQE